MAKKQAVMPCKHFNIHTVYSPDDGGYYIECIDCWRTGPVKSTPTRARTAFDAAANVGKLED